MLSTLALLSNLVGWSPAFAQDGAAALFGFFDGRDIDYWVEGRLVSNPLMLGGGESPSLPSGAPFSGSSLVRSGDSQPFTWDAYQSPKSPEFWDDGGDWIPPRPFREAVAVPTPSNIDQYLAWQGRKAEVLSKFQTALAQRAAGLLPKEPAKPKTAQVEPQQVPWDQIKIAYFYQSSCPHCQASAETIESARRFGAQVTFIQLDHRSSPPLHTPSLPYDQDWNKAFSVTSTPTWIFSFHGQPRKHTGAMSLSELTSLVSSLTTKEQRYEP